MLIHLRTVFILVLQKLIYLHPKLRIGDRCPRLLNFIDLMYLLRLLKLIANALFTIMLIEWKKTIYISRLGYKNIWRVIKTLPV